ncbi:IS110 family transposase [Dyadobacter fanqingshengii]|uniref:IS110 family transposase n=1 Tax=Dyadobacter fanqingshengii TaxID=2906443 RepID=UPI0020C18B83|nr:IS110 family transposase [Dyadobacter fanqingshengii]UTM21866.1 IS110 family transposase [Dyadobacter fanqingshengii]
MKRQPKLIAGVDISKHTLDIALISDKSETASFKINNSAADLRNFVRGIKEQFKLRNADLAFCAENMGLYGIFLTDVLIKMHIQLFLESPLQIKRSLGLHRGKTDKADAIRIAEYARKNFTSLREWTPPRPCINKMQELLTIRKRLLKVKIILKGNSKIERHYLDSVSAENLAAHSFRSLDAVTKDIFEIESLLTTIVQSDETLSHLYDLITSVPGIGKVIGIHLLIYTNEFKNFVNPKKFASFCGVAPFPWSSGISVLGKTKVSFYANKELKSLLHMAAMQNVKKKDSSLAKYYQRKVKEGKNKMSTLNALRNKLIHRIFSCVMNNRRYEERVN